MTWVVIEQDEGLMVDYRAQADIEVLFIDYDESKQNKEYAKEKMIDILIGHYEEIPSSILDGVAKCLEKQHPGLRAEIFREIEGNI